MNPARFGDLVRNSGRPHTLALWTEPKKIEELQKAIRSNRVLTVRHPNVGTKRDAGIIGFRQAPMSSYLIFPRPLLAEQGQTVIGINYALIEEDVPSDPVPAQEPPPRRTWKARAANRQ